LRDQFANLGHGELLIGRGIFKNHLQRTAEQTTTLVDFLDHHLGDVGIRNATPADRAREIRRNTNFDRVSCPCTFGLQEITATAEGNQTSHQTCALCK